MTQVSIASIKQYLGKSPVGKLSLGDPLVRGLANKPSGEISLSDVLLIQQAFDLTELSAAITGANNWINDPVMGWYRNAYAWETGVPLNLPGAFSLGKLRRVEAVFHSYYNTPVNSIGLNYLYLTFNDGSSQYIGASDAWDLASSGQNFYLGDEGSVQMTTTDMVNRKIGFTVPAGKTISTIHLYSGGYNGNGTNYPITKRGIKDILFYFKE